MSVLLRFGFFPTDEIFTVVVVDIHLFLFIASSLYHYSWNVFKENIEGTQFSHKFGYLKTREFLQLDIGTMKAAKWTVSATIKFELQITDPLNIVADSKRRRVGHPPVG